MPFHKRWGSLGSTILALAFFLPAAGEAQHVISVKAGLIHHAVGVVFLEGEPLKLQPHEFVHVRAGQRLRTGRGMAEVLLAPGHVLRAGEYSEVEMVSDDIGGAKVRLLEGVAVIDFIGRYSDDDVLLLCGEAAVRLKRAGVYRVDARPGDAAILRVFRGSALVSVGGVDYRVRSRHSLQLGPPEDPLVVAKFNGEQQDSFDSWSGTRRTLLKDQWAPPEAEITFR